MKYPLFSRIALAEDLPKEKFRRGDVATVVEYYEGNPEQEPGYELEIFDAVGGTIAVATVRESQIEELRSDEVLSVRPREAAAALSAVETEELIAGRLDFGVEAVKL